LDVRPDCHTGFAGFIGCSFQVLKDSDTLDELLKEIPEPSEEMVKSERTLLTLDLIQGSRDAIGPLADYSLGAVGYYWCI
jgi:hypothetical protein